MPEPAPERTPPDDTTDLRERIEAVIEDDHEDNGVLAAMIVDRVVAPEMGRLRAELEEMTACRDSAVRSSDRAEAELATERELLEVVENARRVAEAERDALKEAIERVRTLANQAMKKAAYSRDFVDADAILAALDTPTDRDESGDEADDEQQPCEWFKWIGQSFAFCDGCGRPAWEHKGHRTGGNPFTKDPGVGVEWKPGEAEAIRAKWGRHESHGGEADDD